MKAREALALGILLLLAGAFLYALSGAMVTVYTISSDSYWTYYEFQHSTHFEYQCLGLGVGPFCAFSYYFARGSAVMLFLAGAIAVAASVFKLIVTHVDPGGSEAS